MIDVFSVLTNDGWDDLVRFFTGIEPKGNILTFKMGEGGWTQSAPWTNQVGTGDGGSTYSGDLYFLPVVLSSFSLTAGALTVTDDGAGNLTGNGTGTINYKTGEWQVTFSSPVVAPTAISATYRYRGSKSAVKSEDIGNGTSSEGPYFYILQWRAPDAPIAQGTVTISDGAVVSPQLLTDTPNSPYDGEGTLSGDGSGTINYQTGEVSFLFDNPVATSQTMTAEYQYDGAPDAPSPLLTDLESASDPDLYTFEKTFNIVPSDPTSGDVWEQESGRLRSRLMMELWEGIDDGNGDPPYFFECGIFMENGTMLCYATFTKARKLGSTEIQLLFDQVL